MSRNLIVFLLILGIFLVVRVVPIFKNNFYFTVDQGRDAVVIRDILHSHNLVWRGPETSIRGIYTGPLWYYFLASGYFVAGGDPRGGVIMVVVLNAACLGFVIWWIGRRVGIKMGLLVGVSLSVFWPFYEASSYAFNPFPSVFLTFLFLFCLEKFVAGEKKAFLWSLLIVFLAANSNLAVAAVFLLTVLIITLCLHLKISNHLLYSGVFSGTNYPIVLSEFLKNMGAVVLPQAPLVGLAAYIVLLVSFFRKTSKGFVRRYVSLAMVLFVVSGVFFGATKGWRDWQTVYLAPILFVALVLMVKRRIILITILLVHLVYFGQRYINYPGHDDDQGILRNQLKVLDWVYSKAGGEGFTIYTYTRSYYDYPEQYLFWWYGARKFGYLPCEYSNLPGDDKMLYVPGVFKYTIPKKDCTRTVFLIVEDSTNGEENGDWLDQFQAVTRLVEVGNFGNTVVEKRELTRASDVLFDTNINLYDFWDGPLRLKLPNGWERTQKDGVVESRFPGGNFVLKAYTDKRGCVRDGLTRTSIVIEGTVNDYVVQVIKGGSLVGADKLAKKLIEAVTIVEDGETKEVEICQKQRS